MRLKNLALLVCGSLLGTTADAQQETFLLVSSRNTNPGRMYDAGTGAYLRDWAPPGIGGLDRTQEVIYGPDAQVYVSGIGTPVVLKFDGRSGEYLGPFTNGYELDSPTKISWGPDGLMYVSQWGQEHGRRNVVRFDPKTGAFVDEFTTDNPAGGCDQEWDADGNMYLASFGEKRVIKYAPDGSRTGYFTPGNPQEGPVDLYWAPNGDLMVVDWDHGRVNAHDPVSGAFKSTFIDGMTNTEGITVGPDGRIYAADWTENTINTYSATTGEGGAHFVDMNGGLKAPNSLIFGPRAEATFAEPALDGDSGFRMEPSYPNPFDAETIIPIVDEIGVAVTLDVFDIQGRLVDAQRIGSPRTGRRRFRVDGTTLAPGVYPYRVMVGRSVGSGLPVKR